MRDLFFALESRKRCLAHVPRCISDFGEMKFQVEILIFAEDFSPRRFAIQSDNSIRFSRDSQVYRHSENRDPLSRRYSEISGGSRGGPAKIRYTYERTTQETCRLPAPRNSVAKSRVEWSA